MNFTLEKFISLFLLIFFQFSFFILFGQEDTSRTILRPPVSTSLLTQTLNIENDFLSTQNLISSNPPSITYPGAGTFSVGSTINWSPVNNGGTATFGITINQTFTTGLYNPLNTVMASDGSLYITNAGYHSINKLTSSGYQTIFAGGNSTSYGYTNGTGSTARFRHPSFMAFDANGNLYVADQHNHRIRKISPAGVVSLFAGTGSIGSSNGQATSASFQSPMGLVFDSNGNLYVADAYNNKIRKITPSGIVSDFAGSGIQGLQDGAALSSRFYQPMGLTIDSDGYMYVGDRRNGAIRKINMSSGEVSTLAGGQIGDIDGIGSTARFSANAVVVEKSNMYLVDQTYNSIKHISPSGQVVTISSPNQFVGPFGINKGSDGFYYITENTSNRIRKVSITPAYSITPALPEGLFFDRYTGQISGKSNVVVPSKTFTVTARNSIGTSTTTFNLSIGSANNLTFSPSSSQNYIIEKTFRREYKAGSNIINKPVDSINVNIQYFDGLGRPMQSVQWQASPTKKDVVQHIEYDGFGRESKKYLPYAEQTTNNGSYKTTAKTTQANFYNSSTITDIVRTTHPYSETVFEHSPLNRVLQQGAPGTPWQPGVSRGTTGRTIVMDYGSNVGGTDPEAVRLWTVGTNNTTSSGNYLAGKLYKTTIKDENWISGKAGTVDEYKDFEDRVVLKRVWESSTKKLDTYYVYDDFGDLRYVIPPGYPIAESGTVIVTDNNAAFDELIYSYKYDGRRRLVEKKIPGKGWEWLVYNVNNQLVLSQDAVQRSKTVKEWNYSKYDAFGRVAETGIYTNNSLTTQESAQTAVNAVVQYWETRGQSLNYSNVAFPTSSKIPLLINYYDNYSFDGATTLPEVGISKSDKVKTLLTGTKVSKDDGSAPLLTVNFYDDRARLIQSASQNHLGGTDYVTNTYSFVGELLTSKREHKASASGAVTTLLTTNTYDHVGRLNDSKHKVNSQDEVILARHEYNEIGQLKTKRQHLEKNQTVFINNTNYSYNERGWSTKAASPHFTYELKYNTGTNAQYNGNIAQQLWGHGSTSTPNAYSYTYDKLNRLLTGVSTGTVMSEVLTYDDMGNIKTLKRDNGTVTTYNYTVNAVASNRLQNLTGGITGTYTYDVNGNATKDRTGMTFTYNHLNLPKTATKSGTSVTYLYDAAGSKLRKTAEVSGVTSVRDYVGGIEYSKVGTAAQAIEMIHTGEGYLQNNNGTYTYHYNLTDHLGNVRATLQRASETTGTVIQKHDYYPFGKSKALQISGINKYLYNGKEVQSELGDQQDYGARFYDAEIGRWNVVDPLAEQFDNVSLYNYGMNNPILMIDPDGMAADTTGGFLNQVIETVTVTAKRVGNYLSSSSFAINFGDFMSGGQVSDMDRALEIYRTEGFNAYIYENIGMANRDARFSMAGQYRGGKFGSTTKGISRFFNKKIHSGKQGKHIPGHNNYEKGKSILKSNAQELLDDFHNGKVNSVQKINNDKARVDFGKVIGEYIDPVSKEMSATTKGIVVNSNTGVHIIPARP